MSKIALKLVALSFPIVVCSSCLTGKKVDREVAKHYTEIPESKKKKQNENISITSSLTTTGDQISSSDTKTSNMLPLIVYWQWNYTNTCAINPQIPLNNFIATVNNYSSKSLKQKLGAQHLELSVDKIPNSFHILDKAHLIFLIYATGWDNVSMKALDMEMVVSYRVINENAEEVRKGVITIPNFDDKKPLGMFKNWKTATSEYLTQFDQNITTMSKLVVDKLVAEL